MADVRHAALLQALGVDVYVPRGMPPLPSELPAAARAVTGAWPAVSPPVAGPASLERPAPVERPAPTSTRSPTAPVARPIARPVDPDVVRPRERPVVLDNPAAGLEWEALRAAVAACERCTLHATRTQTVFGVGNPKARWMFIGEAPGAEEDRQGEPFVGRAGQLLTSMIKALGVRRDDVFIANVLKCRPPNNRDPQPEEAASCRTFLERQVELVNPALVIAVGRIAAQDLLATATPIAKLRGKVHAFGSRSWPLIVTYHPAYLLRSPGEKRKAWQDLLFAQQVFARVEREAATPRPA